MTARGNRAAAAVVGGLVAVCAHAGVEYTAEVVTPPARLGFVTPTGMTAGGAMVGYASPTLDEYPIYGATGTAGGSADQLETPIDVPSYVWGVSGLGTIVTGSSGFRPTVWTGGRGVALEQFIAEAGLFGAFGAAVDANESGLVVGELDTDIPHFVQAVYWADAASGPKLLKGLPGVPFSPGTAQGVNEAGQVAGVAQDASGSHFAVRWDSVAAEPLNLGTLEGFDFSNGLDINASGDVAGFAQDPESASVQGFVWRSATGEMTGIGYLPGAALTFSEARALNDAGDVVGVANAGVGLAHAVRWRDGELSDLNDLVAPIPGVLYLLEATAINDAGQVAAAGVTAEGIGFQDRVMVLLTPIVPPACPGDANGDGAVDSVDLNAVLGLFGCVTLTPGGCPADLDGDNDVDSADLNIVLGAFGAVCD